MDTVQQLSTSRITRSKAVAKEAGSAIQEGYLKPVAEQHAKQSTDEDVPRPETPIASPRRVVPVQFCCTIPLSEKVRFMLAEEESSEVLKKIQKKVMKSLYAYVLFTFGFR